MKRTVADLEEAMDRMAARNVQAMIVDLRFNPGGLLTQAVEMGDLFIDDGVIVSTKGRATPRALEEKAHAPGTRRDLPLIVLVNDYSASAAEIVSGALKDTNRAIIVGERTYGKGSVQNVIPIGLRRGPLGRAKDAPAYIKLTTAYYYLPSGRSIHRHDDSKEWGVHPTVEVAVTRDEVQDILDLRRKSDVLYYPGQPPSTQEDDTDGPSTQPDHVRVDPQIEIGLLILRAGLLRKKI
jgi:carboxyl-terminal processing protease